MLRRLILLRHAKSGWDDPSLSDHARPLNARGREAAPRVAAQLKALGWAPEVALVSDAARAQETWALMRPSFGEVVQQDRADLYLAEPTSIRAALVGLGQGVGCVVVVGHNPGMEELASWMAGVPVALTTCNAACFEGRGAGWAEALERGAWRLAHLLRPRELG